MSQQSTFAKAGEAMLLGAQGELEIARALFALVSRVFSRVVQKPARNASYR